MITKEEFLDDTTEEEVFCLIHEFKERVNKLVEESREEDNSFKDTNFIDLTDEHIGIIAEQMITNIKSQMWLK